MKNYFKSFVIEQNNTKHISWLCFPITSWLDRYLPYLGQLYFREQLTIVANLQHAENYKIKGKEK